MQLIDPEPLITMKPDLWKSPRRAPTVLYVHPDGNRSDAPVFSTGDCTLRQRIEAGFGHTQVICAAMIEDRVPGWMRQQKVEGGWLTAEYSMLPYSTLSRKDRPISKGKQDGRNIEIQRLIGRSLRAVLDLKKMPDKTLWIDCDVLRADGGTRTASITGAWLATRIAISGLLESGKLKEDPIVDHLAAISVGVYNDRCVLDLDYPEDRDATQTRTSPRPVPGNSWKCNLLERKRPFPALN